MAVFWLFAFGNVPKGGVGGEREKNLRLYIISGL